MGTASSPRPLPQRQDSSRCAQLLQAGDVCGNSPEQLQPRLSQELVTVGPTAPLADGPGVPARPGHSSVPSPAPAQPASASLTVTSLVLPEALPVRLGSKGIIKGPRNQSSPVTNWGHNVSEHPRLAGIHPHCGWMCWDKGVTAKGLREKSKTSLSYGASQPSPGSLTTNFLMS